MPRRFTIGRERSCDVAIADDSVSRVHAEIWLAEDGAVMMEDRGSSNGTMLIRAGQSSPLKNEMVLPGDQVRFGGVTLGVRDLIEAVEAKNPAALTPGAAKTPKAAPIGPPPVTPARAVPPPLPPPVPAVATPPRAAQNPPPLPRPSPRAAGGQVIRCECGAIKTVGQICPGCNQ